MAQPIRKREQAEHAVLLPIGLLKGLEIRKATVRDIAGMRSLRRRVRENRLSPTTRINEQSYLPFVAASSAWVAEENAQLVGFAAVDLPAASIWALFVDPAAEGLGFGQALHSRMLFRVKGRGIRKALKKAAAHCNSTSAGWAQVGLSTDGEALFEKTFDCSTLCWCDPVPGIG